MELPQGKYKVFRTKKYTIYYLMDDVKVEGSPEKIVRGGHEFYLFGNVIVIKPVKETSQAQ